MTIEYDAVRAHLTWAPDNIDRYSSCLHVAVITVRRSFASCAFCNFIKLIHECRHTTTGRWRDNMFCVGRLDHIIVIGLILKRGGIRRRLYIR